MSKTVNVGIIGHGISSKAALIQLALPAALAKGTDCRTLASIPEGTPGPSEPFLEHQDSKPISEFITEWQSQLQPNPEPVQEFVHSIGIPYVNFYQKKPEACHADKLQPSDRLPRGKSRQFVILRGVFPSNVGMPNINEGGSIEMEITFESKD